MDNTFINRKLCLHNGFSSDNSLRVFTRKNKEYYRLTEDYDWVTITDNLSGLEAFFHRFREWETRRLINRYKKGNRFLDAGCGTGLMLRHLPRGSVGLDINPRNIQRAKTHARGAKITLGDIEKMPFPGGSFTTVICTDVLEHLVDPTRALKELFRVLVPGGVLIGSVPLSHPLWKLRFLSSTHPGEPYHRLYKATELTALLGSKGKIRHLKKGCLQMSAFFAVEK